MFVPHISRHRQLLSSRLGQFTVACWSVVYSCCGCQRHTVCIEENAWCSLERKHTSFLFAHRRRHPSCRFTVSHSTFFFLSVALVYVGTSDRTGTFVCGMFVKCIFVVKCEALHFFTGFSTFIVLHAPRRCLPHVASSNEVCACSSQEAILFRHYRTRFVQPIGKYFSLLIFDRSMMPEILKTAWKQDRN